MWSLLDPGLNKPVIKRHLGDNLVKIIGTVVNFGEVIMAVSGFFFFKYLFILRGRECEREKGRERGSQRIRSRLCTVNAEPDAGLEPTIHKMMT